jgi:hypothetical protein
VFASALGVALALAAGEGGLAVYFGFWVTASLALAFAEWRGLLVALTFASLVLGSLVMLLGLSAAFKASAAAMMAFLAYMVYRSLAHWRG